MKKIYGQMPVCNGKRAPMYRENKNNLFFVPTLRLASVHLHEFKFGCPNRKIARCIYHRKNLVGIVFIWQRVWPTNSMRTYSKKLLVGRKCLATAFRTNEFFLKYDIDSGDVRIEWATTNTHSTGTNCCEQN